MQPEGPTRCSTPASTGPSLGPGRGVGSVVPQSAEETPDVGDPRLFRFTEKEYVGGVHPSYREEN